MISKLLIAWSLTALCVIVQAMGMTALRRWENRWIAQVKGRYWFSIWLLVRTAGWIIFLHLVAITVWALFYAWRGALPDLVSAL